MIEYEQESKAVFPYGRCFSPICLSSSKTSLWCGSNNIDPFFPHIALGHGAYYSNGQETKKEALVIFAELQNTDKFNSFCGG